MDKIKLDIKDYVADTLFITLYAKSFETKQENPLITDLIACELVDKLDYDFSKYKNKKASSVGVAIRASHFDNVAREFITTHVKPIIIMLGCGLDARLQRIGTIADKAIFYELDIAETIDLRRKLIPPQHNENLIPSSMFETGWMNDIKAKHPDGDFMFIIEGVFMYFDNADNKKVLAEIANRFPNGVLYFDVLNRFMSRRSAMHDTVSKTNAIFKSGIDNDKEIEGWHPKLIHKRTWLFNEFKGHQRMGFVLNSLMSIIPMFKTSSRILAYDIAS